MGALPVSYDPEAWQRSLKAFGTTAKNATWEHAFLAEILAQVRIVQPRSLLDVGCHRGHYIAQLRKDGYRGEYHGVDVTPGFIADARRDLPTETFSIDDIRHLGFPSRRFDAVLCAQVLQHLDDPAAALAECCRVAKRAVVCSTDWGQVSSVHHRDGFVNRTITTQELIQWTPPNWSTTFIVQTPHPKHRGKHYITFTLERTS